MVLSQAEKAEFDKLQKKLDHYLMGLLLPFDSSLQGVEPISKEIALDDFYQMQQNWKPTEAELERLKSLAHKDPLLAEIIFKVLLAVDEREIQILNRLTP